MQIHSSLQEIRRHMKRVVLWGFTGAASVAAALGLSSVAHAAELSYGAPLLPVPQAPGPEIPPAQAPVPQGCAGPVVSGPQAPYSEIPPAQAPVPQGTG